jgi:thioester reductase-like protein
LGIAPIGVHESYFDMGGHSLLAPRLVMNIEGALEVTLPLELLLEHPTVAQLSEIIKTIRTEGSQKVIPSVVDLRTEVTLAEEIRPSGEPRGGTPQAIFLTGGTGFLGAYLIREFFEQTDAHLLCLARAGDENAAFDRLRRNLEHHRVWHDGLIERMTAVPGDLTQPGMGLIAEEFNRLAHQADLVVHAGAWVNFTYPYSVLKGGNVDGTREVLRFATTGNTKPFHYVSSTAVFTPASYAGGRALEDDPLEQTEGLFSGYAETKWVCEKVLALAQERGLPVAIYRPGVISGHRVTGVGNTSDMVWNVIKGCIELQACIEPSPEIDVAPVDFVAQAIVYLALHGDRSIGQRFGFANPRPTPYREIFETVEKIGYPIRYLDYGPWRRELGAIARAGGENALVPFLPLFPELPESVPAPLAEGQSIPAMLYDDRNLKAALVGSGISCPVLDEALVRTYMAYFVDSGFIDPPSNDRQVG